MIRGDLERCLIVAPGGLVEQWQEELQEKFGLHFDIMTRDQIEASVTGNPFAEKHRLIVRLDMTARSDELKAKLDAAPDWDLVICDEAHRMSASYFGGEVKETQRHKLGRLLGGKTRNLLLMSATPHNGKEADFQLFMGLLDADRFEGKPREGVHKADVSDMMRRLTKEELYRFDGTPLFPERRAYTASYELSPMEADLYQAVTTYVREEMNRADRMGDDKRRSNVGFALQILQRRLASSPAAIHRSLERRRERLEARFREERLMRQGGGNGPLRAAPALPSYDPDDSDEAPGEEFEAAEEEIADKATAAATLAELEAEIAHLRDLEARALAVKLSLSSPGGGTLKWQFENSKTDDSAPSWPIHIELLKGDNLPIGFSEKEVYEQNVYALEPGALFFFYSDGLTETTNPLGEAFGETRLVEFIQRNGETEPEQLINAVLASLLAFAGRPELGDDLTCVAIRILPTTQDLPVRLPALNILSELSNLEQCRTYARQACQTADPAQTEENLAYYLELAVTEAVANVIKHAYQGQSDHPIQLSAVVEAHRIIMTIRHQGLPFDPAQIPPPVFDGSRDGGFGLFIINKLMDEVIYSNEPNGNHITLIKTFTGGYPYASNL